MEYSSEYEFNLLRICELLEVVSSDTSQSSTKEHNHENIDILHLQVLSALRADNSKDGYKMLKDIPNEFKRDIDACSVFKLLCDERIDEQSSNSEEEFISGNSSEDDFDFPNEIPTPKVKKSCSREKVKSRGEEANLLNKLFSSEIKITGIPFWTDIIEPKDIDTLLENDKITRDALLMKYILEPAGFSLSVVRPLLPYYSMEEIVTKALRRYKESITHCQVSWTGQHVAYRCYTCGTAPTACVCVDCFLGGNHVQENHDYIVYSSDYGGACDCGDPEAWDINGCCSKHGKVISSNIGFPPMLSLGAEILAKFIITRLVVLLHSISDPHRAICYIYSLYVTKAITQNIDFLQWLGSLSLPLKQKITKNLTQPVRIALIGAPASMSPVFTMPSCSAWEKIIRSETLFADKSICLKKDRLQAILDFELNENDLVDSIRETKEGEKILNYEECKLLLKQLSKSLKDIFKPISEEKPKLMNKKNASLRCTDTDSLSCWPLKRLMKENIDEQVKFSAIEVGLRNDTNIDDIRFLVMDTGNMKSGGGEYAQRIKMINPTVKREVRYERRTVPYTTDKLVTSLEGSLNPGMYFDKVKNILNKHNRELLYSNKIIHLEKYLDSNESQLGYSTITESEIRTYAVPIFVDEPISQINQSIGETEPLQALFLKLKQGDTYQYLRTTELLEIEYIDQIESQELFGGYNILHNYHKQFLTRMGISLRKKNRNINNGITNDIIHNSELLEYRGNRYTSQTSPSEGTLSSCFQILLSLANKLSTYDNLSFLYMPIGHYLKGIENDSRISTAVSYLKWKTNEKPLTSGQSILSCFDAVSGSKHTLNILSNCSTTHDFKKKLSELCAGFNKAILDEHTDYLLTLDPLRQFVRIFVIASCSSMQVRILLLDILKSCVIKLNSIFFPHSELNINNVENITTDILNNTDGFNRTEVFDKNRSINESYLDNQICQTIPMYLNDRSSPRKRSCIETSPKKFSRETLLDNIFFSAEPQISEQYIQHFSNLSHTACETSTSLGGLTRAEMLWRLNSIIKNPNSSQTSPMVYNEAYLNPQVACARLLFREYPLADSEPIAAVHFAMQRTAAIELHLLEREIVETIPDRSIGDLRVGFVFINGIYTECYIAIANSDIISCPVLKAIHSAIFFDTKCKEELIYMGALHLRTTNPSPNILCRNKVTKKYEKDFERFLQTEMATKFRAINIYENEYIWIRGVRRNKATHISNISERVLYLSCLYDHENYTLELRPVKENSTKYFMRSFKLAINICDKQLRCSSFTLCFTSKYTANPVVAHLLFSNYDGSVCIPESALLLQALRDYEILEDKYSDGVVMFHLESLGKFLSKPNYTCGRTPMQLARDNTLIYIQKNYHIPVLSEVCQHANLDISDIHNNKYKLDIEKNRCNSLDTTILKGYRTYNLKKNKNKKRFTRSKSYISTTTKPILLLSNFSEPFANDLKSMKENLLIDFECDSNKTDILEECIINRPSRISQIPAVIHLPLDSGIILGTQDYEIATEFLQNYILGKVYNGIIPKYISLFHAVHILARRGSPKSVQFLAFVLYLVSIPLRISVDSLVSLICRSKDLCAAELLTLLATLTNTNIFGLGVSASGFHLSTTLSSFDVRCLHEISPIRHSERLLSSGFILSKFIKQIMFTPDLQSLIRSVNRTYMELKESTDIKAMTDFNQAEILGRPLGLFDERNHLISSILKGNAVESEVIVHNEYRVISLEMKSNIVHNKKSNILNKKIEKNYKSSVSLKNIQNHKNNSNIIQSQKCQISLNKYNIYIMLFNFLLKIIKVLIISKYKNISLKIVKKDIELKINTLIKKIDNETDIFLLQFNGNITSLINSCINSSNILKIINQLDLVIKLLNELVLKNMISTLNIFHRYIKDYIIILTLYSNISKLLSNLKTRIYRSNSLTKPYKLFNLLLNKVSTNQVYNRFPSKFIKSKRMSSNNVIKNQVVKLKKRNSNNFFIQRSMMMENIESKIASLVLKSNFNIINQKHNLETQLQKLFDWSTDSSMIKLKNMIYSFNLNDNFHKKKSVYRKDKKRCDLIKNNFIKTKPKNYFRYYEQNSSSKNKKTNKRQKTNIIYERLVQQNHHQINRKQNLTNFHSKAYNYKSNLFNNDNKQYYIKKNLLEKYYTAKHYKSHNINKPWKEIFANSSNNIRNTELITFNKDCMSSTSEEPVSKKLLNWESDVELDSYGFPTPLAPDIEVDWLLCMDTIQNTEILNRTIEGAYTLSTLGLSGIISRCCRKIYTKPENCEIISAYSHYTPICYTDLLEFYSIKVNDDFLKKNSKFNTNHYEYENYNNLMDNKEYNHQNQLSINKKLLNFSNDEYSCNSKNSYENHKSREEKINKNQIYNPQNKDMSFSKSYTRNKKSYDCIETSSPEDALYFDIEGTRSSSDYIDINGKITHMNKYDTHLESERFCQTIPTDNNGQIYHENIELWDKMSTLLADNDSTDIKSKKTLLKKYGLNKENLPNSISEILDLCNIQNYQISIQTDGILRCYFALSVAQMYVDTIKTNGNQYPWNYTTRLLGYSSTMNNHILHKESILDAAKPISISSCITLSEAYLILVSEPAMALLLIISVKLITNPSCLKDIYQSAPVSAAKLDEAVEAIETQRELIKILVHLLSGQNHSPTQNNSYIEELSTIYSKTRKPSSNDNGINSNLTIMNTTSTQILDANNIYNENLDNSGKYIDILYNNSDIDFPAVSFYTPILAALQDAVTWNIHNAEVLDGEKCPRPPTGSASWYTSSETFPIHHEKVRAPELLLNQLPGSSTRWPAFQSRIPLPRCLALPLRELIPKSYIQSTSGSIRKILCGTIPVHCMLSDDAATCFNIISQSNKYFSLTESRQKRNHIWSLRNSPNVVTDEDITPKADNFFRLSQARRLSLGLEKLIESESVSNVEEQLIVIRPSFIEGNISSSQEVLIENDSDNEFDYVEEVIFAANSRKRLNSDFDIARRKRNISPSPILYENKKISDINNYLEFNNKKLNSLENIREPKLLIKKLNFKNKSQNEIY